jgi:membrane-associated phospholipid phosphatase
VRPVDKLLAGYIAFATVVVVARGTLADSGNLWLIIVNALIALLLWLFTRLQPGERVAGVIHDLYPLALLPVFYSALGIMSLQAGIVETFARDAVVQGWDQAIFGGQISYDWIRQSPSVFWSATLHLAYLSYYPIILAGPILLVSLGRRDRGRRVVLATMIAFVACYMVFALYPVAGPNYAFEHPTGVVREVWSARFVYWLLDQGSAFGTAFPSSHVAATVAATVALWYCFRRLFYVVIVPTILMTIATVYCQMHYGVDVALGIVVGIPAGVVGGRAVRR